MNIVNTKTNYTYEILEKDIYNLKNKYDFLKVFILGKSVLGRNLYCIKIGKGPNKVFYNAAHHALEWITTPVLMKFIESFCYAYSNNKTIKKYNIKDIYNQSSIYIVPMVNPDGIDLVINGLKKDNPYYEDLIKWNKGNNDFSKNWSSNIRGVDLNHNYDASWHLSKKYESKYNIHGPGPTRYSGEYPESEPETKALANFCRKHNFELVLAYHSQGEVIYWNYMNLADERSKKIANILSKCSNYYLDQAQGISSVGGFKDWFIEKYRKPGYTIEVGKGKNPLPISQFDKIYSDNEELLILASLVTTKNYPL
ncbi:g-D-glutamyl-meso-diaminopimelate peptidase [Alkalithermobacter thermoalcaliphilus JW-YL-7 = DSM 7308]|uniref:G-D-glutamyl-meso-diaminopimelate peptidase n=1 Tax=Alkalithermobacter thermoalcaliphilus JW-YL-7 = DSM 7308 TaxID=1121328 RepID=A0A150FR90_CLOPD|nr:peptidase M14 carboxypeptidase A [[Clostridium] paradoxum JW-YL-7 = DSM 7308]SHL02929.1 g-D-glutamyl-meso-diaminopimelate peptidase [[Clostridium] paradoxum JW-YL-7 = DSM 7308]